MDNSQQPSPAQAQPETLMKCCQKTNMRDCDCLMPDGPCEKPTNLLTHYSHQCNCFSCEWVREARKEEVPNHLESNPSGTLIRNCTYAADRLDEVYNTQPHGYCTDLEHVYPIMAAEGPPQEWQWAFQSTNLRQLPYLAQGSQCPKSVMMVTLDSQGKWKGIRGSGISFPLAHDLPMQNRLYRDYGYSPGYSPYKYSTGVPRPPDMANTPDPMVPANRLRRRAADETNTTLMVGSIGETVTDEKLVGLFGLFGQIRYTHRQSKTCWFVQFALRRDALMAMRQLQGIPAYTYRFRISWGDPKVKNQSEFKETDEPLCDKGHGHRRPQKIQDWEKRRQRTQQAQHRFNQSGQGHRTQQARASPTNAVWLYVPPDQQQPAQQQMGYGYQRRASPPFPGLRPTAPSFRPRPPGPESPETQASRLSNPLQQAPLEQPQETVPSPPDSQRTALSSSSDCPSDAASWGSASHEEGPSPERGGPSSG